MGVTKRLCLGLLASFAAAAAASAPAAAQQQQKANIFFIMGDDIGWMQPRIYHRGLMVGDTPNVARIGQEGATSTWPCKAAPPAAMHRYVSGAYRHGRAADSGRSPAGQWARALASPLDSPAVVRLNRYPSALSP